MPLESFILSGGLNTIPDNLWLKKTCNYVKGFEDLSLNWRASYHTCYQICTYIKFQCFSPKKGKRIRLFTCMVSPHYSNYTPSAWPDIIWYLTMVNQSLFTVFILMTAYVPNIIGFLAIWHVPKVSKHEFKCILN